MLRIPAPILPSYHYEDGSSETVIVSPLLLAITRRWQPANERQTTCKHPDDCQPAAHP